MLELRKKGNKHWLFIDNEIGEFTPSKFTINRLNNVITIVYFNNLKSKDYNVSDCYIFDIGDISGFNTSDGVAFMDKLEELNCPCFQKNENIFNISGGAWGDITGNLSNQTDLQTALDSKLDKSTTASSVYGTNTAGGQTMIPLSELGGGYIEKKSNLNVTITGTTVETVLYTKNIGVITTNNLLKIEDLLISQEYIGMVNASGIITLRIRISDSPTLPTDIYSIIATLNINSNINTIDGFAKMERTFTFTPFSETQYTIICAPANFSSNTDIINTSSCKSNLFGQLTNNKYLFITAQLPYANHNCTLRSLIIRKV